MTVEIDRVLWESEYGIPADDTAELRNDVQTYIIGGVVNSAAARSGAIIKVAGNNR